MNSEISSRTKWRGDNRRRRPTPVEDFLASDDFLLKIDHGDSCVGEIGESRKYLGSLFQRDRVAD